MARIKGPREDDMPLRVSGTVTLLQVFDMPTSLRFYRDLLGFEVVQRSQPANNCGWAYEEADRPSSPDRKGTSPGERQPGAARLESSRLEIGNAPYVSWGGVKLESVAGHPALALVTQEVSTSSPSRPTQGALHARE
jgi:catechol 2,3-dioxygenase-like lactoylglutathione lyase family enzyme